MPPVQRSRFPGCHRSDAVQKCSEQHRPPNRPEDSITITPTYTKQGGSKLTLNGSAVVHTNFLGVIGVNQIDIGATSVSTWGNTRLRVALVLDNTGSMASSGKRDALKTASHNLLTQLKNAAFKPEDVYVSIVPFSKDVNFGAANYEPRRLFESVVHEEEQLPESRRHMDAEHLDVLQRRLDRDRNVDA